MNQFASGFKGGFSGKALGASAALFVLLVVVAYFGFTPESTAARIRAAVGG